MLDRGQRTLDWLSHSPLNERGFLLNYDADTGRWKDQDPVSQGQAMESFGRAIQFGRKRPGVNTARWEEFLRQACAIQAQHILQPDWKPRNTAEAFFVAPLCKGYVLFGEEDFKRAAVKAGEYYAARHVDMAEPYWGGTLDANCEDKEGAWAAFQAFLALYELTREPRFLDWAAHAMDVTLTRSDDLESWTYQGKILDQPGTRNSDATIGKHADVIVCGDRAYIIYFTHPYTEDVPPRNGISPFSNRHTALQAAELEVRDGRLVCDRDKVFRIRLTRPHTPRNVPNRSVTSSQGFHLPRRGSAVPVLVGTRLSSCEHTGRFARSGQLWPS